MFAYLFFPVNGSNSKHTHSLCKPGPNRIITFNLSRLLATGGGMHKTSSYCMSTECICIQDQQDAPMIFRRV